MDKKKEEGVMDLTRLWMSYGRCAALEAVLGIRPRIIRVCAGNL